MNQGHEEKHQSDLQNKPTHLIVGRLGEDIAEKWLISKGHRILDRNWRTYWGEIDLITKKGKTTFFVEVKTSAKNTVDEAIKSDWRPEEHIDERKIKRLYRTIEIYANKKRVEDWSVLALAVRLGIKDKKAKVETFCF